MVLPGRYVVLSELRVPAAWVIDHATTRRGRCVNYGDTCVLDFDMIPSLVQLRTMRSHFEVLNRFNHYSLVLTQVRGYCSDESNPEIFDEVNVYGNIYDSEIHDNYFGVYTYGEVPSEIREDISCHCRDLYLLGDDYASTRPRFYDSVVLIHR